MEFTTIVFLSAKELVFEMVEKIMLSDDDYILIDDLQLLPKDKALEEKIAMLIETNKKQLIILQLLPQIAWKFLANYRNDYNGD